ncbi:MAG: Cof-type HAD-IIB family hydrolase [Candidatus Gastranaerophilales bacterium]|nr:Cof-type HAD-IIB family hydrolase [Candidatus Gastranaerophilales bacterium]
MKAIFFDIDGTLVNSAFGKMAESTAAAIRKARENGHLCFINTGRTWCLVKGIFEGQAEFDGYLLGCGTMILYRGKVLMHKTFSPELSQYILDALERYRIDALLEGVENVFCKRDEEIHSDYFRQYAKRYQRLHFPDYTHAAGKYDKLFARTDNREDMEAFRREFERELDFIDREEGFYEILSKGYSKSTAICYLAEKLGIPMGDTVAVGDSNNDIPMLSCVHTAIAMENSTKEVLSLADYVTGSVEKDGIWEALQWLGVI